jgi:penicillin-binding protein 1A
VKLNLSESALLAGLIRSPNRYSPLKNPQGAAQQRNVVLDRMLELKRISPEQAQIAKSAQVTSRPRRLPFLQENYAMDAVQRDLNILIPEDVIDHGGLKIYTTLDPVVQKAATEALESHLSKVERQSGYRHMTKSEYRPVEGSEDASMPYLEGAVVVIDNTTGGIRGLVGGRDYQQSKFNRALPPANRQVGSAFKPFVYALAFTYGLLPGAGVSDDRIIPGEIAGAGDWSPENSDNRYNGVQPVGYGLVQSRNTMSVRIGEIAGLDHVRQLATTLGLVQEAPNGPAMYIGSFESNLKDLTAAYTVFPNAGVRRQAYVIERIDDANDQPIYRAAHVAIPAVDPSSSWMTLNLLKEVLKRGTAASSKQHGFDPERLPAGGKTGTTNDYKDAWFLGFTSSLTCGVWVGFDQPTTVMSRGYGSALALPVWTATMKKASARYPANEFRPPVPLARAVVCSVSNQLATGACQSARAAYQITLPTDKVPPSPCHIHGGQDFQFAQGFNNTRREARKAGRGLMDAFKRLFGR